MSDNYEPNFDRDENFSAPCDTCKYQEDSLQAEVNRLRKALEVATSRDYQDTLDRSEVKACSPRKGSITASCGHKLTEEEGLGHEVVVRDQDRDGTRVTRHSCVCTSCFEYYKRVDLLLNTAEDIAAYLAGEDKDRSIILSTDEECDAHFGEGWSEMIRGIEWNKK